MPNPTNRNESKNQCADAPLRQSGSTVPYVLSESTESHRGDDQKLQSYVEKTDLEEDIWKEQASEPEDLKSVVRYLQQVIADNE